MFKRCLIHLLLPSAILATASPAHTQQVDFGELERVALEEIKEANIPGAAVAVVSGDRVVYAQGLGVANIETGAPVTPDILFQIGSLTKMLTSAALVALSEAGELDLHAPIGNYVKGLSPRLSQVTAHQLLSQTSGLMDMASDYGPHEESALADYARSLQDTDLLMEPGMLFSYSNPGFALAGLVAEAVGGEPYADLMSSLLFKPLGMDRTTLRPSLAMTYPLALGHNAAGEEEPTVVRPLADNTRLWPAGYVYSSVNDFSRFVIALMNGGKIDGKQALAPAVVTKLLTPYADIPTNVFENGKYGYGLFIRDYRGLRVAEHGGTMPGVSCEVRMAPEHHFAVLVFANKDGARLNKTFDKAFELVLPVEVQPAAEPKQALPMREAEMARYVGSYSNRWLIDVFVRDGTLFLKRFGDELPVSKVGDNRFSVTPEDAPQPQEFLLVPGADGKAEYMQMFVWAFKKVEAGE